MSLVSSLNVPSVHFDLATGVATIVCEVSADHLVCFLHGLAHLQRDHGVFNIPDTLPPDMASAADDSEPA